jgi:hypothetical protein
MYYAEGVTPGLRAYEDNFTKLDRIQMKGVRK